MRNRKRLIWLGGGAALVALVALLLTGALLSGSISERIQREADARIDGEVRWSAARVSLLRDFPRASVRLDDLVVAGSGAFAGDTLLSLGRARVVFDLGSLIRSVRSDAPLEIVRLDFHRRSLRLLVLEDGAANWDIVTAADRQPAGAPTFRLDLQRVRVTDGAVVMDDRATGLDVRATGIDVASTARIRDALFRIHADVSARDVSFAMAGVPYLSRTHVRLAADVDADTETGEFAIADAELHLNEMLLAVAGSVRAADRLAVDLRFNAPRGTFDEIASLVPGFAAAGWSQARAGGTVSVDGWVRGDFGDEAQPSFPAFSATVHVRDGMLRHPDMALPLSRVNAAIAIVNGGGAADSTVIDLSRLQLALGDQPVEGRLTVRTPLSDPAITFRANGTVDLADVPRTFPMDTTDMAGSLAVDVEGRFRFSDLDAGRYERVSATGNIHADGVHYLSAAVPEMLFVDEFRLQLSPERAELSSLQARLGSSDVAVSARLNNLLGFVLRGQELSGTVQLASRRFDLDAWRSDDEVQAVPVPARIDLAVQGRVERLAFAELDMRNVRGALRVKDQRATLEDLEFELFGGGMAVAGFYETLDPAQPAFDVELRIRDMQVAQAAAGFVTVQALAPAARYAHGTFSTELRLAGVFGSDLTPILDQLDGRGTIEAAGIALEGFPGFDRLADAVRVEALRNPTLADVRSTFSIRDGRVHVSPFQLRAGGLGMTVSGSHGFDESLEYRFAFELPESVLGSGVGSLRNTFAVQAGRLGIDVAQSETLPVVARMGGSVRQPSVALELQPLAPAVAAGVRQEAERRLDQAGERIDERVAEERRRAEEAAERRLAEAELRAAAIRAEAVRLADAARSEADVQANALVAQAGNPVARRAAEAAAARLRRQADERADTLIREADARAARLIEEARGEP
jgi:hypothetical protein